MASFDIFSQTQNSKGEITRDRLATINRIGDFLYTIGRWTEAYNTRVFHLQGMRKFLGVEHPDTLTSMNNLALVLNDQGKYEEAEEMHRQALALYETVLGRILRGELHLGNSSKSQELRVGIDITICS